MGEERQGRFAACLGGGGGRWRGRGASLPALVEENAGIWGQWMDNLSGNYDILGLGEG